MKPDSLATGVQACAIFTLAGFHSLLPTPRFVALRDSPCRPPLLLPSTPMAPPDLNSVPPSFVNPPSSSQTTSLGATPRRSSQMTGTPLLPNVTSSGFHQQQDDANTPMRHPRPLTAAELHLQLEKEQEAVVCLFLLERRTAAVQSQNTTKRMLPGEPPCPRALRPPSPALCIRRLQRVLVQHERH